MRRFLALVAVACSSGTTESTAYRSQPEPYQQGAQHPSATQCTPDCVVTFPVPSNGPSYCWSLGQADCDAAPGAWVGSVPACGESALWLHGCSWNPSGGCEVAPVFYVATQGCEP